VFFFSFSRPCQLKVATAPHILHFPPTEGKHAKHENQRDPNKYETYDMARYGLTFYCKVFTPLVDDRGAEAEEFVRFLEQIVGHSVLCLLLGCYS